MGQSVAQLLPQFLFLALLGEYVGFVVAVSFAGVQVGAGNQRDPVSREQFNGYRVAQNVLCCSGLCGNGRGPAVLPVIPQSQDVVGLGDTVSNLNAAQGQLIPNRLTETAGQVVRAVYRQGLQRGRYRRGAP